MHDAEGMKYTYDIKGTDLKQHKEVLIYTELY